MRVKMWRREKIKKERRRGTIKSHINLMFLAKKEIKIFYSLMKLCFLFFLLFLLKDSYKTNEGIRKLKKNFLTFTRGSDRNFPLRVWMLFFVSSKGWETQENFLKYYLKEIEVLWKKISFIGGIFWGSLIKRFKWFKICEDKGWKTQEYTFKNIVHTFSELNFRFLYGIPFI